MSLRLSIAFVIAGLSVVLPQAGFADEAAQARFYDRVARSHYAAGEYRQALRAFFEEQRLAPNPRIVFNIALCFERLEENEQAYAFYVEYLAAEDEDAVRRKYATKAKARLAAGVSRVRVATSPPGAEIFIDEPEHGSYGRSPREVVVSPGKHEITVSRQGYRTASITIEVAKGELTETSLAMTLVQGTLRLTATPTASVQIRDPDGRTVAEGTTPFDEQLPTGVYNVEFSAAQYQPAEAVVRIDADRVTEQSAVLVALPKRRSEVVFTSNVSGALVEVDGKPIGFAPVVSRLDEGGHDLRITHPERAPYTSDLMVRPQQRAWLTAQLELPARTERSPWAWVSGGTGAALLGTGVVVGLIARERRDEFTQAQAEDSDNLFDIRDDGQNLSIAADVLMVTGVAAIITGVVLYFTTEREAATPSSATLAWETE